MRTIFKYPLTLTDHQLIELPKNSECLTVQMQKDVPCLWAVVDRSQPNEVRTIHLVGTGQRMPDGILFYLGTVQDHGFVWHFFLEVK
jgi:hypothetical protein